MTKNEAINLLEGIIVALDTSSSNGEEIDWALDSIDKTREDLKKAFNTLSWLEEEDRMGK